ncbi:MAG: hypothetical protein H0T49_08470, partial [Chloroflexia bacterium]|nr:hypothetical protein [Chloroflexia bacterium]
MTARQPAAIPLLACWAKLDRTQRQTGFHPLLYHLIDVAVVTETLWNEVLPAATRQLVADDVGLDRETD